MRSLLTVSLTCILVACATSPTGKRQFTLFSESQMAEMGSSTFASMQQSQKLDPSPRNAAYVNCIVNAIIPELNAVAPAMRGTQWEVKVFADDSPNAFALPGGKIGVHTGMLTVAKNQHQLASVLGHEIGHVWAKHSNQRVSQTFATQTGMQLASVAAGEMTSEKQQLLGLLGVGAQFGVLLPFSRKHESEADEIGLELMARAGFDPRQSVELWRNMQKAGGGSTPEFLSTHPGTDSRIRDLNARMDRAMKIYQQAQASDKRPNCRL